jgi:hypothetical protein
METYFDSRIDLIQRRLQKHGDGLKRRAQEAFKINNVSGELIPEHLERELKEFRTKVRLWFSPCSRIQLNRKIIALKDIVAHKLSFCYMAFRQGCTNPRQGHLFLWCHVTAWNCSVIWYSTSVRIINKSADNFQG